MSTDPVSTDEAVGFVLRAVREELNLHRSDVETDELSQHYVAKLETGERTAEEALRRYADVLSVDLAEVRALASCLMEDDQRRAEIEAAEGRARMPVVKRLLRGRLEELGATQPAPPERSDLQRRHVIDLIGDLPAEAVSALWRVATTREERWIDNPVSEAQRLSQLQRLPVELPDVDGLADRLKPTVHDVRPWHVLGVAPDSVRQLGQDSYEVHGKAATTTELSGKVRVTRRRDGALLVDARDVHQELAPDRPSSSVEDALRALPATLPWTLPLDAFLETRIHIWPDRVLTTENLDEQLGTSDRPTARPHETGQLWNSIEARWDYEYLGTPAVEAIVGHELGLQELSDAADRGIAVITAFNPQSIEARDASNRIALRGLARTLIDEAELVMVAEGAGPPRADERGWTEPSLATTGLDRDTAIEIAAGLGQTGIFWIEDGVTCLLMCFDPNHPYPSSHEA